MSKLKELIFKSPTTIIATFAIILIATVGLSETLFGDLTATDSLKPLWVIIPVMSAVALYLIFAKKE
jgi:hypothetical protein